MTLARSIDGRPRSRAVADAPVEALLEGVEELSRRWAAALVLARPLDELSAIPLDELARSAPALCEALARALASDDWLERLAHDERQRAALAPLLLLAPESAALVADLDALRSILWDATLDELRDPSARLVVDLADRLAHVCSVALATLLDARTAAASAPAAPRAGAGARTLYRAERDQSGRAGVTLIDELGEEPRPLVTDEDDVPAWSAHVGVAGARSQAAEPDLAPPPGERSESSDEIGAARTTPRARPWDTPLSDEPTVRASRGPGARVDERS